MKKEYWLWRRNSIKLTARVRALEVTYPGVRISIGSAIYIINDPIKFSQFVLEEGEVKLASCNRWLPKGGSSDDNSKYGYAGGSTKAGEVARFRRLSSRINRHGNRNSCIRFRNKPIVILKP